MPEPILFLQDVFVSRGGAPVLHSINLTLHPGEHLAILGPNGCGKSTLLKTVTCELYPLAVGPGGERPVVRIFGRARWDLTELRRRLGVVSPDLPGKPTLHTTGFDSILTGFFSSSTLWPNLTVTDPMRSRAEDLLHLVGAENLRRKPVGEMSAGQQRRIMIARALAGSTTTLATNLQDLSSSEDLSAPSRNPGAPSSSAVLPPKRVGSEPTQPLMAPPQTPTTSEPPQPLMVPSRNPPGAPSSSAASSPKRVGSEPPQNLTAPSPSEATQQPSQMLLLDEPSNALDLAAQADLRSLLRDLARGGTAIVLITHHTADIIPEIGRVLLMRDGRIVADGPKGDLLTVPTLSDLFRLPVEVTERDGFFHAR